MLRWLVLLVLLPSVAAQAPTLSVEVSTGEFVIDGEASFHVNGTFACQAFDVDPDVVYTIAFSSLHYTSGGANVSGIEIQAPSAVSLAAPCFPDGVAMPVRAWSAEYRVVDHNATPGAMYHMDLFLEPSVQGRLGQEAPKATGVHTMGSPPLRPLADEVVVAPEQQAPGLPLFWLLLVVFAMRR